MTVKELTKHLRYVNDDRIIAIERPDEPEDRSNQRYLNPTGGIDVDKDDEYFVIYTD